MSELHLYEGEAITVPAEIPVRVSTYQFDYEFIGWFDINGNGVLDTVGTKDITYFANYTPIDRYYTITFLDWNGTVLKEYSVKHDEIPTCEEPTREETAQYFYDFDGWDKEIVPVTGEAIYTATYLPTLRTYTVTWKNEDGTVLEGDINVPYGTMPEYNGATPTKQGNAQYTYTFKGWHIEISEVTGDITYEARYTATVNKYTVIWKNEDGTVLETDTTEYGLTPTYDGTTPTKVSTVQYDFVFAGWDTAISEVTGDVVYTAVYTNHIRSYTIKFIDYNSAVIKSETLEYGSSIVKPNDPTRTGYTFTGWSPNVATTVTGEATYTAQYSINYYKISFIGYTDFEGLEEERIEYSLPYGSDVASSITPPSEITRTGYNFMGWDKEIPSKVLAEDVTINAKYEIQKFTIRFINEDGTELYSKEFEYGSMPSYSGSTPTKSSTAQYHFTFAGWGNIVAVTGEAVYTAQFTKSERSYTVTWKNDNGTVLKTETVKYGVTPQYSGSTPTKTATAQYTYTHKGWTPSISAVTGNVAYTATFTEEVRVYTITWKVGNQTKTTSCAYGSTPTPPSEFEVGKTIVDGGTNYTIKSWNLFAITKDTTFVATKSVTGATFSAKFTKYSYQGATGGNVQNFLAGTGDFGSTKNNTCGALIYGLNFEELRNFKNVKVTDLKVEGIATNHNVYSDRKATLQFAYNLGTSSNSFTDTGDGSVTLATPSKNSSVSFALTKSSFPNTLSWINNNMESFLNGYTATTFGAKITTNYSITVTPITITITCDYDM